MEAAHDAPVKLNTACGKKITARIICQKSITVIYTDVFCNILIFKRHCSCTARSSFFSERVIDIWNSLPSNAVDFTYLASFKRSISSFDFSQYPVGL